MFNVTYIFKLQPKNVKSNTLEVFIVDVYLRPYQTCIIDFFSENSESILDVNYFRKRLHHICGALRDLVPFVQFK